MAGGRWEAGVVGSRRGTLWAALATVYVVWGSTYLAIRLVVATFPPFLSAALRFLVAAALVAGFVAARRGPGALRVARREAVGAGVVGVLLLLGGNGLVVLAERDIDSGLAALVVAGVPLWVVLLRLVSGDRPRPATVAGVLVGLGGLGVLLLPGGSGGGSHVAGVLTVVAASMSWSVGSFLSARLPLPGSAAVTTAYEMAAGGVALLLAATLRGEWTAFDPAAVTTRSWLALGYLVVFGSVVAFSAYAWLLARAPISLTATYAYVNPAVAVALGALLLGEPVTPGIAVGGAVVLVAVGVVVTTESRARSAVARAAAQSAAQSAAAPEPLAVADRPRG